MITVEKVCEKHYELTIRSHEDKYPFNEAAFAIERLLNAKGKIEVELEDGDLVSVPLRVYVHCKD